MDGQVAIPSGVNLKDSVAATLRVVQILLRNHRTLEIGYDPQCESQLRMILPQMLKAPPNRMFHHQFQRDGPVWKLRIDHMGYGGILPFSTNMHSFLEHTRRILQNAGSSKRQMPPLCSGGELLAALPSFPLEFDIGYGDAVTTNVPTMAVSSVNGIRRESHQQRPIAGQYRNDIQQWLMSGDGQVVVIADCAYNTEVPQCLLEVCHYLCRPCRALYVFRDYLSAVNATERISRERNEQVGHTVGYQIHQERCRSNVTNILCCADTALLSKLSSREQSEATLRHLTHIIVSEAHRREDTTDLLLSVLKDKLKGHPTVKLIVLTVPESVDDFVGYFGGCHKIGMLSPGEFGHPYARHLEEILQEMDCINTSVLELKRNRHTKGLQKIATLLMDKGLTVVDGETADLLDDLLHKCYLDNGCQAFEGLFRLLSEYCFLVNYRHSTTKMTALAIACARGYPVVVNRLLEFGANPTVVGKFSYTAYDWCPSASFKRMVRKGYQDHICASLDEYDFEKLLVDVYLSTTQLRRIDHHLVMDVIFTIYSRNPVGTILVYLPGGDEVQHQCQLLLRSTIYLAGNCQIFQIHSNITADELKTINHRLLATDTWKIILSHEISESILKLPGKVFVVDTGLVMVKRFDVETQTFVTGRTWITRSMANRRASVGKESCFRLYSRKILSAMTPSEAPAVLSAHQDDYTLLAVVAGWRGSVQNFYLDAINPLPASRVASSLANLRSIYALDTNNSPTNLGRVLCNLQIDVRLGRVLLYALLLHCADPILTIVCALSFDAPFRETCDTVQQEELDSVRQRLAESSFSDCLVLLRAYQRWNEAQTDEQRKQVCQRYHLRPYTMEQICNLRLKLISQLRISGLVKNVGIRSFTSLNIRSNCWSTVKGCLAAGLFPNVALNKGNGWLVCASSAMFTVRTHPSSVIQDQLPLPSTWMVFSERVGYPSVLPGQMTVTGNTLLSPMAIVLLCGNESVGNVRFNDPSELSIDDLIIFTIAPKHLQAIRTLRAMFRELLMRFFANPVNFQETANDRDLLIRINTLLVMDDARQGFAKLRNIGQKPLPRISKEGSNINLNLNDL